MLSNHNQLMQTFVGLLDPTRMPYIETGRKFDKVILQHGTNKMVTYFVARHDLPGRCVAGDIFGAKSKLAPNMRWRFGNLTTCTLWDWSGEFPVNVSDPEFVAAKKYGTHVHYIRIPTTVNSGK